MHGALIHVITPERAKTDIDQILARFFSERTAHAAQMGTQYEQLWQSIARLSRAGGKRFRPYMALLAYQSFGGRQLDAMLQPAAAWELLHLCLLIHDDVIDNDRIRYGVDNVAGQYEKFYGPLLEDTDAGRRSHLADSAAILAGDIMLSAAHEMILGCQLSDADKLRAARYLTDATFTVAGGELMDTESVLYDIQTVDPLSIALHKTAGYSFAGPLGMGAALGGAGAAQLALLERFAMSLGIAYQLTDDLIGIFGNPAVTGKSVIGDIREGKRTYLIQQAFARAKDEDAENLRLLVGKPDITDQEAAQVREIIVRSGARAAVERRIDEYAADCRQTLDQIVRDTPDAEALATLLSITTKRDY